LNPTSVQRKSCLRAQASGCWTKYILNCEIFEEIQMIEQSVFSIRVRQMLIDEYECNRAIRIKGGNSLICLAS